MKRNMLLSVLVLATMLLAACAAPTPEVVEKEVVVEKPVVQTVEVEKEVVVEKESSRPSSGEEWWWRKKVVVTATPETKEPVILRYADKAADLGTMDPHFAAATNDRSLVEQLIFNALVRYKPGDGSVIEPDLAEALPEPELVGGKQVWTFKLRRGVMCHPSDAVPSYELTSEDVVWSLQKSANPDTSAYAGEYDGMTVEAVDDYTVKVTMESPLSPVLFFPKVADYAGGFIVCKKSYEAVGAETFKTNPSGTGPFMFDSYSPQEKIVLAANEAYFRGRPLLDGVEYRFMPDINSRELGLMSGELDVINGAAEGIWVERMSKEEGVRVDVYGVGEVATVHFDITVPPLDDVRVRKAIAYALERDEFLALFGEPVAANVYSPGASSVPGRRSDPEGSGRAGPGIRRRSGQGQGVVGRGWLRRWVLPGDGVVRAGVLPQKL